ncbi:MAG: tRNA (adenosine(37)-N6)-dimethylallyltransferase MiaA [Endomicrobium sp.]|jgi:tRNA dimethylallyltransferase|nr:tRNA (adenosine(37)-N6)-dimethylallyltransferase MiaA [Endomicrobium sp.]
MKKIIVISGATASGKTKKAVEICKKENGEIISCDSRQIYKYLDVGTNKEGVMQDNGLRRVSGIVQYLTDLIEPDKIYNAADFVKDADFAINQIIEKKKIPVIAGGTGLYIKALLYGLDEMPKADDNLRKELKLKTVDELYDQLSKLDPEAAVKNRKNPQRLLRALEVNILSGKTMSEHFKPKKPRYDFIHYNIYVENEILYERINNRCKKMIDRGMTEETQKVLDMGFDKNCPALNSIGYRHITRCLNDEISKEKALEEFSKDTRHYAKRQNTWFRSQSDMEFIKG